MPKKLRKAVSQGQPLPPSIWCETTSNKWCMRKLIHTLLGSNTEDTLEMLSILLKNRRQIIVRAEGSVPRSPLSSSGVDFGRGTFDLTPRPAQLSPSSTDPDFSPPPKWKKVNGGWHWAENLTRKKQCPQTPMSIQEGMMPILTGDPLMLSGVVGSHGGHRCPATPRLNNRPRHTHCHKMCSCCPSQGVCLPPVRVNSRLCHRLQGHLCNVIITQRRSSILDLLESKTAGCEHTLLKYSEE